MQRWLLAPVWFPLSFIVIVAAILIPREMAHQPFFRSHSVGAGDYATLRAPSANGRHFLAATALVLAVVGLIAAIAIVLSMA